MEIEKLLERLDNALTDEEVEEIGREILKIDPNNPYGKLAVWQNMEYENSLENLDILREALESMRLVFDVKGQSTMIDGDRDSEAYCTIMMSLGFSLLAEGNNEEALSVAQEFILFDREGCFPSRELLYSSFLSMNMYEEILNFIESDSFESVIGIHARAIALIETDADEADVRDAIIYAISADPDVPFFILNIWEFPEDENEIDGELEDSINYSIYLTAPWCATDERLAAISTPTFLFGYLTDRLDDEREIKTLKEGYEGVDLLLEVETAKEQIKLMENDCKDPDEIDAFALRETSKILELLFS